MKIDDPVSEEISWMPLTARAYYKRLKIVKNQAIFKMSPGAKKVEKLITTISLTALLSVLFSKQLIGVTLLSGTSLIIGSILTLVFALERFYNFKKSNAPDIFDKNTQKFTKGLRGTNQTTIRFTDIYALQLIEKYVETKLDGQTSSHYYYQLNLVLSDRNRFHLIDFRYHSDAMEDSEMLASFLDKPLWARAKEIQ